MTVSPSATCLSVIFTASAASWSCSVSYVLRATRSVSLDRAHASLASANCADAECRYTATAPPAARTATSSAETPMMIRRFPCDVRSCVEVDSFMILLPSISASLYAHI